MNVLYISYDGITDPLGQSQVVPYVKGLARRNFKILLLSFEKDASFSDKGLLTRLRQALRAEGIIWKPLKYHKSPSALATSYDVTAGIFFGLYLIIRYKIQLIHARSYVASMIAIFLKKISAVKFIFDMRGFWPEEKVEAGIWRKESLLYRVSKFFEGKFIDNSDWIIVLSKKAKEILENNYLKGLKINIEVIPTCADLDLFSPFPNNSRAIIANIDRRKTIIFSYSGSVGTWYCLEEMINFFKKAKQRLGGVYFLLLISNGREQVHRSMVSAGFKADEFMIRQLLYKEVPEWLALSDINVFFIKPISSKLASCPTKMAESLACGVPVLINAGIGDTAEIVNNENIGVVVSDFQDLEYEKAIEALKNFLSDRENLKRRCRLAAEKYFALDDAVQRYASIYQRLER